MGFYRNTRRIKRTPEEAAELAAHNLKLKQERERNAMTCQCCGRKFLANMGTIAHHGYQRPGGGWQTASCIGAKHAPFEVARDRLGLHIEGQKKLLKGMVLARTEVQNESRAILKTGTKRQKSAFAPKEHISIEVTRTSFEGQQDELRKLYGFYGSFDDMLRIDLANRASEIKSVKDYILMQTERFNGWKLTHEWSKDKATWVAK
jgi:hypothetical protein